MAEASQTLRTVMSIKTMSGGHSTTRDSIDSLEEFLPEHTCHRMWVHPSQSYDGRSAPDFLVIHVSVIPEPLQPVPSTLL